MGKKDLFVCSWTTQKKKEKKKREKNFSINQHV